MRWTYGFHPIRELLRHRPHAVARVFIAAQHGKRRAEIENLCRRHRIEIEHVSRGRLDELISGAGPAATGGRHNGFAAHGRSGASETSREGDPELLVLLEDVQDPRNLGALLRVCEATAVGEVMIRDRGSAPMSATAVKASAGAAEWLPVRRVTNSARVIEELKSQGYWVYGADASGEAPWEIDLTGKVVLCMGGEGAGLRARTRKICDRLVGLPMRGKVESLNVSTAAAAVLYEAVRQREEPAGSR